MAALVGHQMASNHRVDGAWCSGCGLHQHVTGEHRDDCTAPPAEPAAAASVTFDGRPAGYQPPIGRGRCPSCGFHTPTQGHRDGCPDDRRRVDG